MAHLSISGHPESKNGRQEAIPVSIFRKKMVLSIGVEPQPKDMDSSIISKLALVIGNGRYTDETWTSLTSPTADATLITQAFREEGFLVVGPMFNLSSENMRMALKRFGELASRYSPNSVAVIYYSGHGIRMDGVTYVVPTDVTGDILHTSNVRSSYISENEMLAAFGGRLVTKERVANVLIIDACRNNIGKSSQEAGDVPENTIVAYATSPGATANEGKGGNSAYALALVRAMHLRGAPAVFGDLGDYIKEVSNIPQYGAGEQKPTFWSRIRGSFCLNECFMTEER